MGYSLAFTQAIGVLIFIGGRMRNGGNEWIPNSMLSESLGIPRPTTVHIVGKLVNARLITTKEGIRGGNRLALDPADITLHSVLQAVEAGKPLFRTHLRLKIDSNEVKTASAKIMKALTEAEKRLVGFLDSVSVADLMRR